MSEQENTRYPSSSFIGLILHWIKCIALRLRMPVIEYCKRCGRRMRQVWRADDSLWAAVTGREDGTGVLCVRCFDRLAQKQGRLVYWRASLCPFGKEDPSYLETWLSEDPERIELFCQEQQKSRSGSEDSTVAG